MNDIEMAMRAGHVADLIKVWLSCLVIVFVRIIELIFSHDTITKIFPASIRDHNLPTMSLCFDLILIS